MIYILLLYFTLCLIVYICNHSEREIIFTYLTGWV